MLRELIEKMDFEYSLLLLDTAELPARMLLHSVMLAVASRESKFLVVDLDRACHPKFPSSMISYVDCSDLPEGHGFKEKLLIKIIDCLSGNSSSSMLCFASLSVLDLFCSVHDFAFILRQLKTCAKAIKVIGLLHTDVVRCTENVTRYMQLFDATVNISPLEPGRLDSYYALATSCRRKASGKVQRAGEYFSFNVDYTLGMVHSSSAAQISSLTKDPVKAVDPAADLTFNLHLNEQERAARSRVQLPYVKQADEKNALLNKVNKGSGGRIYYEYDKADDFDEEDPDDDLDI